MFEAYTEAAHTVANLVDDIAPGDWDRPGLGDWDLRALVGHTSRAFITVLTYLERPAASEDIEAPESYYARVSAATGAGVDHHGVTRRGREAGAALGDQPAAAFRELADQAIAALQLSDPTALITTIAGGQRVATYVPTRTVELVVHGLDIAAAADLTATFSAPALAEVATVLARTAVRLDHGPHLLRALTGRDALPPHFSLV